MKLSSYAIVDQAPDGGALYAVVTLDNGGTFGQWLLPGTTAELDAQVQAAIDRQAVAPAADQVPVGTVRTQADISLAPKAAVV